MCRRVVGCTSGCLGKVVKVGAFSRSEKQRAGQCVENIGGGMLGAALLEADVVVRAQAHDLCNFLAPKAIDPTSRRRRQAHVSWSNHGATGAQVATEFVALLAHTSSIGRAARSGVLLRVDLSVPGTASLFTR